MNHDRWNKLKEQGEMHYWTNGVELIDLFHSIKPHQSLTVGEVSALTSIMRYATRMLVAGINDTDIKDIKTYAEMIAARREDVWKDDHDPFKE